MTDEQILDIASLINTRWGEAIETLKRVKAETYDKRDGSLQDWEEMHAIRFNNAEEAESYWLKMRNDFINENRSIFTRMLES